MRASSSRSLKSILLSGAAVPLLGTTNGKDSDKVEFCIACHAAAEDADHLMFLPEEYRKK